MSSTELSVNFEPIYIDVVIDNLIPILSAPDFLPPGLTPWAYVGTAHRVDELSCPRLMLLASNSRFESLADGDAVRVTHTLTALIDVLGTDPDEARKDLMARVREVDRFLRTCSDSSALAGVDVEHFGDFEMRVNEHAFAEFPRQAGRQEYLLRAGLEVWIQYLTG